MKPQEFDYLDVADQAELLYNHGTYLASLPQEGDDQGKHLYGLETFFAEVHYDLTAGGITRIESFHSYQRVLPYLDQLDLDQLLRS
ncbi:hypothetical protein SAMN05421823_102202 [Catalinimonas alkaloidigena]|uniref:Uncharacterized protein n=1 Tax=Catalinimonas alkaloidigena TaxID=1075417 RepID=A0A1G9A7A3_9BACT|nr:hypothetical protein [Catalinimonas alkaloidigena]SDK23226.1 hypothetical protein SAMN05421823_102202 [Catalinimonas alkaloidigena]